VRLIKRGNIKLGGRNYTRHNAAMRLKLCAWEVAVHKHLDGARCLAHYRHRAAARRLRESACLKTRVRTAAAACAACTHLHGHIAPAPPPRPSCALFACARGACQLAARATGCGCPHASRHAYLARANLCHTAHRPRARRKRTHTLHKRAARGAQV